MFLRNKHLQKIMVSHEAVDMLQHIWSQLPVIKQVRISDITHDEDGHQFVILTSNAEDYYQKILFPIINSSQTYLHTQVAIEFLDDSRSVSQCQHELLVSFDLKTKYAFGNPEDNDFIIRVRSDINSGLAGEPAAMCYYVISDATVTMCMTSSNLDKLEKYIGAKLIKYGAPHKLIRRIDWQTGRDISDTY